MIPVANYPLQLREFILYQCEPAHHIPIDNQDFRFRIINDMF